MKKLTIAMLLSASIFTVGQAQAHSQGTVKDNSGKDVTTGTGDCLVFGNPEPGLCHGGHAHMGGKPTPAAVSKAEPASADNAATNDEPVVKEVINLTGVIFKTNSDILDASSNSRLDKAAQTLMDNPDMKVIVAGHTDSDGDALYNLSLSEKRAQAVKDYLVNKGVDGARLTARGYGETEPFASNDRAAGRAKNRRVELRILE